MLSAIKAGDLVVMARILYARANILKWEIYISSSKWFLLRCVEKRAQYLWWRLHTSMHQMIPRHQSFSLISRHHWSIRVLQKQRRTIMSSNNSNPSVEMCICMYIYIHIYTYIYIYIYTYIYRDIQIYQHFSLQRCSTSFSAARPVFAATPG